MARDIKGYFARRLAEEEDRAATAGNPVTVAAHKKFAAVYRAYLEGEAATQPSQIGASEGMA